mmetsp:Transcript_65497/g.140122  ORF Transcript_65497/g.140122 Transcript_65497/m.140122 type:complete len:227 (+) Transcript_65497:148-828(+)
MLGPAVKHSVALLALLVLPVAVAAMEAAYRSDGHAVVDAEGEAPASARCSSMLQLHQGRSQARSPHRSMVDESEGTKTLVDVTPRVALDMPEASAFAAADATPVPFLLGMAGRFREIPGAARAANESPISYFWAGPRSAASGSVRSDVNGSRSAFSESKAPATRAVRSALVGTGAAAAVDARVAKPIKFGFRHGILQGPLAWFFVLLLSVLVCAGCYYAGFFDAEW